ncbi:hypothetical protein X777_16377, partial [Ooceraea biroi]
SYTVSKFIASLHGLCLAYFSGPHSASHHFLLFILLLIMRDYSPAEIVDMIKIVGLCNDNLKAAQRVYAARFPDRQHPTRKTMKLLLRRAQEGRKTGPKENNILVTLAAVELNPNISTRNIENEHGIPQKTVDSSKLETLTVGFNFATGLINIGETIFLHAHETTFTNRGGLNRHNCHYWSNNNLQWQQRVEYQHQ